jgi:acetyltransferase-like isoleucine patch superfamily enzyme
MLRKLYLSPFGVFISILLNLFAWIHKPFMAYGYYNSVQKKFLKKTRISSSTKLVDKHNIDIADEVWVGHYGLLDGIGGILIGKGVNIASHSCIYTHSSQDAIRLMGNKFIDVPASERLGYIIQGVEIGEYTFIGTSCVILPGTKIGKGCIVGAGSVVKGNFPDYSILVGNPAKIHGDTRLVDQKYYEQGIDFNNYYEKSFIKDGKYKGV